MQDPFHKQKGSSEKGESPSTVQHVGSLKAALDAFNNEEPSQQVAISDNGAETPTISQSQVAIREAYEKILLKLDKVALQQSDKKYGWQELDKNDWVDILTSAELALFNKAYKIFKNNYPEDDVPLSETDLGTLESLVKAVEEEQVIAAQGEEDRNNESEQAQGDGKLESSANHAKKNPSSDDTTPLGSGMFHFEN